MSHHMKVFPAQLDLSDRVLGVSDELVPSTPHMSVTNVISTTNMVMLATVQFAMSLQDENTTYLHFVEVYILIPLIPNQAAFRYDDGKARFTR